MRRLQVALIGALVCSVSMGQTLNGFITGKNGPQEVSVDSMRVRIDSKSRCASSSMQSFITPSHSPVSFGEMPDDNTLVLREKALRDIRSWQPCNIGALRVGQRVRIDTDRSVNAEMAHANTVIIYNLIFFHQLDQDPYYGGGYALQLDETQSGALLEESPKLSENAPGEREVIWANGYPLTMTQDTKILVGASGDYPEYLSQGIMGGLKMDVRSPSTAQVGGSLASLTANHWVVYKGNGFSDAEPFVSQVEVWQNTIRPREREYILRNTPTVTPPQYGANTDGRISYGTGTKQRSLSIPASRTEQEYVQQIGSSLIPQYQRELSASSESKVSFRFFVVREISPEFDRGFYESVQKPPKGVRELRLPFGRKSAWHEAALAMPDGTIVVPEKTLVNLHSEAELAAILSYCITNVLQKHSYLAALATNVDGGDIAGSEYERGIRMSIRQMLLSGYDISKAPIAWSEAQGPTGETPKAAGKPPSENIPWYEEYAFTYLSQYYPDVNFSSLKRNESEYQQFLQELIKTNSKVMREVNRNAK